VQAGGVRGACPGLQNDPICKGAYYEEDPRCRNLQDCVRQGQARQDARRLSSSLTHGGERELPLFVDLVRVWRCSPGGRHDALRPNPKLRHHAIPRLMGVLQLAVGVALANAIG
jgi:hypothetical protein